MCLKHENNIYISSFEGITLSEFVKIKSFVCMTSHNKFNQKFSCDGLIRVTKLIECNGFMKLKEAFEFSSPERSYTSSHAHQKLLQMPVAAIGIGNQAKGTFCFVVVKKRSITICFNHFLTKTWSPMK